MRGKTSVGEREKQQDSVRVDGGVNQQSGPILGLTLSLSHQSGITLLCYLMLSGLQTVVSYIL